MSERTLAYGAYGCPDAPPDRRPEPEGGTGPPSAAAVPRGAGGGWTPVCFAGPIRSAGSGTSDPLTALSRAPTEDQAWVKAALQLPRCLSGSAAGGAADGQAVVDNVIAAVSGPGRR